MSTRDVFGREFVPVVTAAQAVEHDRVAHQEHGIPDAVLMSNAGRALAQITNALYPTGTIVGVAGKGHNGDDTVIALQALQSWGRETVLLHAFSDDVAPAALASASVILDGILGTGSTGSPRGRAIDWIRAINDARRPVIAVDWPSGANADSTAVCADVTVSFGFPKLECLFNPARSLCGRLIVVEIGFPPLANVRAQMITPDWAVARLPRRAPDANKGTSGRLLLIAGSKGMAGAAVIAGGAAVRSGAGLVRIVSSADNREIVQRSVPESIFFEHEAYAASGTTAIVLGPGLGQDARRYFDDVVGKVPDAPILLDADGLNAFAGAVDELAAIAKKRSLLLTPHPKEMSRLTGERVEDITGNAVQHAQGLADRIGATVLLKGQPSIVAAPDLPVLINSVGSSDFAVAGMGDQLSGVAGAMLAAGLDARTAAAIALYFGGRAGDLAALGRALTPLDVTDMLPRAFIDYGATAAPLGLPFITFDQPARW